MEFRHKSWCNKETYKLLRKYNVAWVTADRPFYPKAEVVTADFVCMCLHGSKVLFRVLFSSKYTKKELSSFTRKIKKWLKQKLDIYVCFNNDAHGYAIENAKELLVLEPQLDRN